MQTPEEMRHEVLVASAADGLRDIMEMDFAEAVQLHKAVTHHIEVLSESREQADNIVTEAVADIVRRNGWTR